MRPLKRNGNLLRGAIIGFGNVAVNAHLPALFKSKHFILDAVVESDPQRLALAQKLIPEACTYPDIESLLKERRLDFVDICTPNSFHGEMVLLSLKAKVNVLCEKPLAISLAAIHEIDAASRAAEKVVFTVNNWKYAPLWIKASQIAHSGAIGEIRSIWLAVLRPNAAGGGLSNWRRCPHMAGGGILMDHGWHNLYLILSLLGDKEPISVRARMSPNPHNGFSEQTVDLRILFCETAAHLHLTWQGPCRQNQGIVEGTEGAIRINDDHLVVLKKKGKAEKLDFFEPLSQSSHHSEWMAKVFQAFYREIMDTARRGENLKEAAKCTVLTHLAYASQMKGCELPVNDPFIQ